MSDISWEDPQAFEVRAAIFDTAVILFAGDQVSGLEMGESPLKSLLTVLDLEGAAEAYRKYFAETTPDYLPRYNLRVETLILDRMLEDNHRVP